MAKWNNNKFKTWLVEINATKLSQEKLKSKAVMFCEEFGEVDKKTISKIVEDFEKEHNRIITIAMLIFRPRKCTAACV